MSGLIAGHTALQEVTLIRVIHAPRHPQPPYPLLRAAAAAAAAIAQRMCFSVPMGATLVEIRTTIVRLPHVRRTRRHQQRWPRRQLCLQILRASPEGLPEQFRIGINRHIMNLFSQILLIHSCQTHRERLLPLTSGAVLPLQPVNSDT